jgi:hypothetical protein
MPRCAYANENGLTSCHMTHAAVHVLRSLRARFPGKHFVSADADVGPTVLSEVSQWLSIGRECQRLRMPRANRHCDIRDGIMPGLLVCNDIGARVNAGLAISPGVGEFNLDLAQTPQAWCRLLHDRLQRLKASKRRSFSDFDNQRYSSRLAALSSHTKLYGVLVEESQDYLHLWAVLCNVLTVAAWCRRVVAFCFPTRSCSLGWIFRCYPSGTSKTGLLGWSVLRATCTVLPRSLPDRILSYMLHAL